MQSTPSIKTNYGTFDVSGCEFLNIIWNRVMDFKITIPRGTTKIAPMTYMYDNILTIEMKVALTSFIKRIIRNFGSSSPCQDWMMYGDRLEINIKFPMFIIREENSSFVRMETTSSHYVISSEATDDCELRTNIRL